MITAVSAGRTRVMAVVCLATISVVLGPSAGANGAAHSVTKPVFPVTMSLTGPAQVKVGRAVDYTVQVTNISHKSLTDVRISRRVDTSASVYHEDELFTIAELRPGATFTRTMTGSAASKAGVLYTVQLMASVPGSEGRNGAFFFADEIR